MSSVFDEMPRGEPGDPEVLARELATEELRIQRVAHTLGIPALHLTDNMNLQAQREQTEITL